MNGCIYRTEENKCKQFSRGGVLSFCYLDGTCDCRIPSNADRIRSMSDEGLADFLDRWEMGDVDYSKTFCNLCDGQYDCHEDCLMDWLKSPVEVDE